MARVKAKAAVNTLANVEPTLRCLSSRVEDDWAMYNGDCVEVVKQMPAHSVGFSIYSPPFESLFTYSDSLADMGNCGNSAEFQQHYRFLLKELTRVTKPGRLSAVHCSNLPLHKWKDGVIGIKDFRGDIIRAYQAEGWTLHSETTIWRDPVVEMTRTHALGLLHMQLLKDSVRSRCGMADYLEVFRAPGENAEPVGHEEKDFPVDQWQQWASPVWMDIRQTDTLNVELGREDADERHICPLQLGLIERAITMWSNPGDVVLSPFAGIGSEGVVSMKKGRKFVGVELKESYFKQAIEQIKLAKMRAETSMFRKAVA